MMHVVYLSLGSNIRRYFHISEAVTRLNQQFSQVDCSPVYESEAIGFEGEAFLNLVVKMKTTLSCSELNQWLKQLEDSYGRDRDNPKFSSRTIDLDILLYDDLIQQDGEVELPRAEILKNAFVLQPLNDIAPNLVHPILNETIQDLWERYDQKSQKLWQVSFNWPD